PARPAHRVPGLAHPRTPTERRSMSAFELWFWLTDPLRGDTFIELAEPTRLHGLLMALAVGVLLPLSVLLARYFKILPRQDWPRELSRRFWWSSHLAFVYCATVAAAAAMVLVVMARPENSDHAAHGHAWIGWVSIALLLALLVNGWQRGST